MSPRVSAPRVREIDQLRDARWVGEVIGAHPETVRRMAREGRLPAVRRGKFVRFPESEIRAYVDGLPPAGT